MATIVDLQRRMSRKIDRALGVTLSPFDLDLLVESGAWEAICQAALAEQKRISEERKADRESKSPPRVPWRRRQEPDDDPAEALARALEMTRPSARKLIGPGVVNPRGRGR